MPDLNSISLRDKFNACKTDITSLREEGKYVEDGFLQVSHPTSLQVIDGKQRLATILLFLSSMDKNLNMKGEKPFDGFYALKIPNRYFVEQEKNENRRYKLLLLQNDNATLTTITESHELPNDHSIRIRQNFNLFNTWIAGKSRNLTSICKGLLKLIIAYLALYRHQDSPQLIFKSIISTGRIVC